MQSRPLLSGILSSEIQLTAALFCLRMGVRNGCHASSNLDLCKEGLRDRPTTLKDRCPALGFP